MSKGRWKINAEDVATEAYLVLIRGQKPGRTFTKEKLRLLLLIHPVSVEFFKLCFEFDDTDALDYVRKGLLLFIQSYGPSDFCREQKINRNSAYRMLAKNGNPSLKYCLLMMKALKIRPYVVSGQFFEGRKLPNRPKDVEKAVAGINSRSPFSRDEKAINQKPHHS
jgi:DNA-binding phage protein